MLINSKKIASLENRTKFQIKKTSRQFLAFSTGAEKHPMLKDALTIYQIAIKNKTRLIAGEEIFIPKLGIQLKTQSTGNYKGHQNRKRELPYILRIRKNGKSLFLKIIENGPAKYKSESAENVVKAHEMLAEVLHEMIHTHNSHNIRMIVPKIIYGSKKYTVLASQFMGPTTVSLVKELPLGPEKELLSTVLSEINQKARSKYGYGLDVSPQNAFYEKSTKTLLLFDAMMVKTSSIKRELMERQKRRKHPLNHVNQNILKIITKG